MLLRGETWRVALEALRANRLRAFLSTLGVVIGSACIVLVVTIALSGRRYVVAQIEAVGSNVVWAELVRVPELARARSHEMTTGDLDAVRAAVPDVVEVAGTRELPMSVVVAGAVRPVNLVGVTLGFQAIRHLVVQRGRFLDAADLQSHAKLCLLTEELARRLFPVEDPIGRSVRLGEPSFTVVGVVRERVATFGLSEIQRESVLVPLSLVKYYAEDGVVRVLYVQARRAEDVPAVTRRVEALLKSRHPGAAFDVQNLGAILDATQRIAYALTLVLLLVAFIALVISGVGIMNVMLVTVTERTREIGVRRAVGAGRREILWQFLLEALLISGLGASVGILIALCVPFLVRPLLPGNLSVPVSWLSVTVAFAVSCATGILFGYLPARRAAGLPPSEALRYE
jgi:putative ABC transport system permease protein